MWCDEILTSRSRNKHEHIVLGQKSERILGRVPEDSTQTNVLVQQEMIRERLTTRSREKYER